MALPNGATIAGYALLSAIAVAGWVRNPYPQGQSLPITATPASYVATSGVTAPVPATAVNQPAYQWNQPQPTQTAYAAAQPPACAETVMYTQPAPVYSNGDPRSVSYVSAPAAPAPRYIRTARYAPVQRQYAEREYIVRKKRSTGKSVAIVAGGAGAGAAIGALAGGGKGAAIGALAGSGAGFLYDRLTRNR